MELHRLEKMKAWYAQYDGLTTEERLTHPNFVYSRFRSYGISFYARDPYSPTGVSIIGGCSHEEWSELQKLAKTSPLSPTEDLRTAH